MNQSLPGTAAMNIRWVQIRHLNTRTVEHHNEPPIQCRSGNLMYKQNGDYNRHILDYLIRELENFATWSHAQPTPDRLQDNYNKFYSLLEDQHGNRKTHHRSSRKLRRTDELDTLRNDWGSHKMIELDAIHTLKETLYGDATFLRKQRGAKKL